MPASSKKDSALRKIIMMVAIAIVVFLGVTTFSVHKSFQSGDQLAAVRDLYFPVLQKIEANIVRLDKMEELFTRAVMIGDHDPIDEAGQFFAAADKDFTEMARLYPDHAADIQKLRAQYKQYHDLAHATAEGFLSNPNNDIKGETQRMASAITALRDAIRLFREASYGNFVDALGDSQNTVTLNLYMGIALGCMNLFFMGVLVFFIRNNVRMMAVIEEQNANLEKRVAERTAQLRQKTHDIQAMLQNMPQGVMTVLPGGVIHPEYAAYVETIFETSDIAGRDLMGLVFANTSLGADDLSQVDAAIGSCIGEDLMNFEFNSHLLATAFSTTLPDGRVKHLELGWSPICDENEVVEKLMLCVRDVTELKRLASEADAQKRELEIIGQILAVTQEKFNSFMEGATDFVRANRESIARTAGREVEVVNLLFRNMHTIKGNARTYGLVHLTNLVHEIEQTYDELRKSPDAVWQPAAMLAQLDELDARLAEHARINEQVLGRKGPGRRGDVSKYVMVEKERIDASLGLLESVDECEPGALRSALVQVRRALHLIGTERLDEVLAGVTDSLPSLARELGKEPPVVVIEDHGLLVRTQVAPLLKNVFTHLLRNAVDHGLQTAEARVAAGKAPAGRIELDASVHGGMLRLKLRDDGRGIAIARIRQRAVDKQLMTQEEAMDARSVAMMIFAPGFSTAERVTEVSGRGVGMDAVRGFIAAEGGRIDIRFLDEAHDADFRQFELCVSLPDKYAVSSDATPRPARMAGDDGRGVQPAAPMAAG